MTLRYIRSTVALTGMLLATTSLPANAALTNYGLLATIAIPATAGNTQGGTFTSFDVGWVDGVTSNYYISDRSNKSVDVISGASNRVIGQVTGFAGQGATAPATGPNGIVVVNNGVSATLYVSDAGMLRSFDVTDPAKPIAGGVVNSGANTGVGPFRVDEFAYSPTAKELLLANNANPTAIPFASLVSVTNPLAPVAVGGKIFVPGQAPNTGLEPSVWDPKTNSFFISVPSFNGTDAGGVQEFDTNGNSLRTYSFTSLGLAGCAPAGIALGDSGNLAVGCSKSGTQTVILNPATGAIIASLGAVSGSDLVWYDPPSQSFYVTGLNTAGDRVIGIFSDKDDSLQQSIDLTSLGAGKGAFHSVAVDPLNGEIFVPLTGTTATATNGLCPAGCVAVFAQNIPEPGSLPVTIVALTGMAAISISRRRL